MTHVSEPMRETVVERSTTTTPVALLERLIQDGARLAVFSRQLASLLRRFPLVTESQLCFRPREPNRSGVRAVLAWRRDDDRAERFASSHRLPLFVLSEGMLGGCVSTGKLPLSLLVDHRCAPDDRGALGRLLHQRATGEFDREPSLLLRARELRARIRNYCLGQSEQESERLSEWLRRPSRPWVMVVDQEFRSSMGEPRRIRQLFDQMLEAARCENPAALVVVVGLANRSRRGVLGTGPRPACDVFLDHSLDRSTLCAHAEALYTFDSDLGFEGCLAERRVVCFGRPFYAGLGLTDDRAPLFGESVPRSPDELAAAVLLESSVYALPVGPRRASAEDVAAHLTLRRERHRENQGLSVCVGMAPFRRPTLREYLRSPDGTVEFAADREAAQAVSRGSRVRWLVWGLAVSDEVEAAARARNIPIVHVEDGFLRSAGLGSDFSVPGSLVFDTRGLYCDPRVSSDLEVILETAEFTLEELEQSRRLRKLVIEHRVSKYNPVADRPYRPRAKPEQVIVLVPGQVGDDVSVRFGSTFVPSNDALVREVRRRMPDAYLIFKPHPDVVAGNRAGAIDPETERLCDEIVTDVPVTRCLELADQVHTMTSLVGFEALLREKPTTVYGQPFYAGWGLTEDLHPVARRTRRLSIDELAAGVWLRYPRYFDFESRTFCTAFDMVVRLGACKTSRWVTYPQLRVVRRAVNLLRILGRSWHVR